MRRSDISWNCCPIIPIENWLVFADSSALPESLVSFPTAKQDQRARQKEHGQETKRDDVVGRHSWRSLTATGVYVPNDARKAQAG
jgi:hypothetical protein